MKAALAAAWLAAAQAAAEAGWRERLAAAGIRYEGRRPPAVTVDRSWEGGSRRLVGSSGGVTARVSVERVPDEAAAARILGELKARLLAPFEGDMGYPGMITRSFGAPPGLRPVEKRSDDGARAVWIVPATRRLTYGAGSAELVARRAVVSARHCPGSGLVFQVELFWPATSFDERSALAEEGRYACGR